jgi:hypothetical protein
MAFQTFATTGGQGGGGRPKSGLTKEAEARLMALRGKAISQGRKFLNPMEVANAIDPSGVRAAQFENEQFIRRKAYREEAQEKANLQRSKLMAAKEQMELSDMAKRNREQEEEEKKRRAEAQRRERANRMGRRGNPNSPSGM